MKIKVWIGIIISALFIWLAFRKIDFSQLVFTIKSANYIYLLPAIGVTFFQFFLRAVRWGYILEPVKKISTYSLFSSTMIGFMANNILPARIGEFVKAYSLGKKENLRFSASFATIVIERILDVFALLVVMLVVLSIITLPSDKAETEQLIRKGGALITFAFLGLLIFLYYFKQNKDFVTKIVFNAVKLLSLKLAEKIHDFLEAFASGLSVLQKGKHVLLTLLYSLLIWFISAIPVYFILLSFGYVLPFSIALFILLVIALAVAVPSAPGFIGTFHFACALGLELFNIPEEKALSVAIVIHAVNFFPVTLAGLLFLWKEKISLSDAEALEESSEVIKC